MFGQDQGGYEYGYGVDDYPLAPPPHPPPIPTAPWTRSRGYGQPRFSGNGRPRYPRYFEHNQGEVRLPPVPGEDYYHPMAPRPPPSLPACRPSGSAPSLAPSFPPGFRPSASAPPPDYRYSYPPQRHPRPYPDSIAFPHPPRYIGLQPRYPRPRAPYEHFRTRFSSPYPRPPPFPCSFPEETVRVRRQFVHDTVVPSNYDNSDWYLSKTKPAPASIPEYGSSSERNSKPVLPPGEAEADIAIATAEKLEVPLQVDEEVNTPVPTLDIAKVPLELSVPPMSNWQNSNINIPESVTELRVSDPNLAFVPVPADKIDLVQMTKAMQQEKEAANSATMNSLKQGGLIAASWPKELRDMFQPLYCKLCTLTLSSPIVAAAHYKGKKHKKGIDKWLHGHREANKALPFKNINKAKNLRPTGVASAKIISPPNANPDFIAGTITQAQPGPPAPVISGPNAIPLGYPMHGLKKRPLDSPTPNFEQTGSSKRFPLGRPPKKPKTDPKAGPNFGFCNYCQVTLTSQSHYDQHYAGKPHKKKVQEYGKPPASRNCFTPQTHEPYAAPTRPLIRPGLNISFPSYF